MSALERDYALIEAAAVKGERCPQNAPFGPITPKHTGLLVREGRIRIDLYRNNWRVATILQGPHKGKSTARCPHGSRPIRTYSPGNAARSMPSAPKDYSRGA